MYSTGSETVDKIGMINIEGNIIPFNWFSVFKFDNGKPDLNAIVILSEIVYWYRPKVMRDEESGATIGIKKKFKADLLQRSYDSFAKQFGLTKRQVKEAFDRLCAYGVITREFRSIETENTKLFNVLFIDLNAEMVASVSLYQGGTFKRMTLPLSNVTPPTLERDTNTENTTKTTTDILYTEEFEKFWSVVPNKDGKKVAAKSFKAALKKKTCDELIQAYSAYIAYCGSINRILKNPSTWLNGDNWEDQSILPFMTKNINQEVEAVEQPVRRAVAVKNKFLD